MEYPGLIRDFSRIPQCFSSSKTSWQVLRFHRFLHLLHRKTVKTLSGKPPARLTTNQSRPDDTNWIGAEIKSCCRLASLLDVPLIQAAQNVVPVAVTSGDKIEQLRQWASGRVLSADLPGIYSRQESPAENSRVRRVMREPRRN